jgi:hypothetical protein
MHCNRDDLDFKNACAMRCEGRRRITKKRKHMKEGTLLNTKHTKKKGNVHMLTWQ